MRSIRPLPFNRITLGMTTALTAFMSLANSAVAQGDDVGSELPESTSFAKAFFISEGSMFGTAIIWFLLALSIASFGLMGYLWLANRRVNIVPEGIVTESNRLLSNREYRELLALTTKETSFFSEIVSGALKEASHGFASMVRALEQASDELISRRLRQIEILNVIGNVAPMIGLFGTVYGMILTFQGIVSSGGRPDPVDLAGGIGTALTTTFWGLVVAIPSLAGYAIIRNNIDSLTSEASLHAGELVNHFKPAGGAGQAAGGSHAAAQSTASTAATRSTSTATGPQSAPSSPAPATLDPNAGASPLTSAVSSTSRLHPARRGGIGGGGSGGPHSASAQPPSNPGTGEQSSPPDGS